MSDLINTVLNQGRYLVSSLLAQTPDCSVFSARDMHPWLNQPIKGDKDGMVAIKASENHQLLSDEKMNLSSLEENHGFNSVSSSKGCPCEGHANNHLPIVHGLFSDHGLSFLVTELLGPSLHVILSNQRLDTKDAKDVLRQTCCTLEALHGAGKAHWDLKTSNICSKRKKVKGRRLWKLIDFAHLSKSDTPPNFSTPRYAPPESILLNYEPRLSVKGSSWDMWSLGCLAFESFTGDKLFEPPPEIRAGVFTLGDMVGQEEDKAMMSQMIGLLGPPPSSIRLPRHMIDLSCPPPPLLPSSIFLMLPEPLLKSILPMVQRKKSGPWSSEEVKESLRLRILRTSPVHMSHEDISELSSFLSPLLDWDPLTRSSAIDASNHKLLK